MNNSTLTEVKPFVTKSPDSETPTQTDFDNQVAGWDKHEMGLIDVTLRNVIPIAGELIASATRLFEIAEVWFCGEARTSFTLIEYRLPEGWLDNIARNYTSIYSLQRMKAGFPTAKITLTAAEFIALFESGKFRWYWSGMKQDKSF